MRGSGCGAAEGINIYVVDSALKKIFDTDSEEILYSNIG